jgi:hypothetical protein
VEKVDLIYQLGGREVVERHVQNDTALERQRLQKKAGSFQQGLDMLRQTNTVGAANLIGNNSYCSYCHYGAECSRDLQHEIEIRTLSNTCSAIAKLSRSSN